MHIYTQSICYGRLRALLQTKDWSRPAAWWTVQEPGPIRSAVMLAFRSLWVRKAHFSSERTVTKVTISWWITVYRRWPVRFTFPFSQSSYYNDSFISRPLFQIHWIRVQAFCWIRIRIRIQAFAEPVSQEKVFPQNIFPKIKFWSECYSCGSSEPIKRAFRLRRSFRPYRETWKTLNF